jgi:transposase-like protein
MMPVHCPRCQSKEVRRSKRRGIFELSLLSMVPMRPYRCEDCDRRFYAFTSSTESIPSDSAPSRLRVTAA